MVTAVQPIAPVEPASESPQQIAAEFRTSVPTADSEPLLRLVIEEDPSSGDFIYKTVDRMTGEVVRQFPREEMLRMARQADYTPGDVIETEA